MVPEVKEWVQENNITLFTRDIMKVLKCKLKDAEIYRHMHFKFHLKRNAQGERVIDEFWTTDYWLNIEVSFYYFPYLN